MCEVWCEIDSNASEEWEFLYQIVCIGFILRLHSPKYKKTLIYDFYGCPFRIRSKRKQSHVRKDKRDRKIFLFNFLVYTFNICLAFYSLICSILSHSRFSILVDERQQRRQRRILCKLMFWRQLWMQLTRSLISSRNSSFDICFLFCIIIVVEAHREWPHMSAILG